MGRPRAASSTRCYEAEQTGRPAPRAGGPGAVSVAEGREQRPAPAGRWLAAQHNQKVSATLQKDGKKPNILVIWGDDIGVHNISAYNHG